MYHGYGISMKTKLYDIPQLRQKLGVFQDRRHAGQVLAEMLREWKDSKAMVFGVPSGAIPVAVPTVHEESLGRIIDRVDALYCANNIRSGPQFAVAAAYRHWGDVAEVDADRMLALYREGESTQ